MTISWDTLGTVDPRRVVDARLQLHWAAQAASAPARQLLEHRPDYSEQSLRWVESQRALAQDLVDAVWPFRTALRTSPPAVLLIDRHDRVTAELALDGCTLEEVYIWLEHEIPRRIGRSLLQPLQRPGEGLPEHGIGAGERFSSLDTAAFSEVGRWFANAHRLLSEIQTHHREASQVRCWPHHFDLATLIGPDPAGSPPPDTDAEAARSIGVGLSPGDGGRPHPYFYVTPWPCPQGRELPPLDGGGTWNSEGWTGAVLETAALLRAGAGTDQGERAERFLDSAIAACRSLLAHDEANPEGNDHGH